MKLRIPLLCLVFPAAVVSVAQADDDLVTPCYGPEAGELMLTTEVSVQRERYRYEKGRAQSAEVLLEYALSDRWALSLDAAETVYREHSLAEPERVRYRETETYAGLQLILCPSEQDELYAELGGTVCRPSRGAASTYVGLEGYWAHEFERLTGLVTFAWESPVDQGRENNPEGQVGVAVYTKVTENSGITTELDAVHATAEGQRVRAELRLTYGYQFNEHLAATVSAATLLHDFGKTHGGEPYDAARQSTTFGIGLRVRF